MKFSQNKLSSAICLALFASSLSLPVVAIAQESASEEEKDGIERIEVTSRKKVESIQDIPLTVNAISSEFIEEAHIENISEIADHIVGFSQDSGFGRQFDRPVIRGLSQISGADLAGYFVDGVFVSGSLKSFDLESIERVEVIKGPQSAVFGRRTFSGAVNYITKKPSGDDLFKVKLEAGSHGHRVFAFTSEGAFSDDFSYRLTGRSYQYDSEFENTKANGPDVGGEETRSLNLSLYYSPSENTDIHFNVSKTKDDDEQYAITMQPSSANNCFEGKYYCGVVDPNIPISLGGILEPSLYGIERDRTRSFVQIEHDMGFADLTWTSAFNKLDYSAGQDQTYAGLEMVFSFAGFFGGGSPFEPATAWHTYDSDSVKDSSHEVRLAGSAMSDKLDWSVGAYYYKQKDDADQDDSNSEVVNKAIMASLEYQFTDQFTASWEARYSKDTFDGTLVQSLLDEINFDTSFSNVTHRLTASYKVNDDVNVYANWAQGTMPGSFNTNTSLPSELIPIEEQQMDMTELGVKSFLGENTRLNVALYKMDWDEQTLSETYISPETELPVSYLDTVGATEVKGVEIELSSQITDSFSVDLAYAKQDSEIINFFDSSHATLTGTDGSVAGNSLPLSPDSEWSAGFAYEHEFSDDMRMVARMNASYQGSRYVKVSNFAETGSATTVSGSINLYVNENSRISLWGKNLTDEDAAVSVLRYIDASSFFFGGRTFVVTPRRGREFGVTYTHEF